MTDVEERLAALAPTLAGGEARIADLSLLTGGASMETWAFTLMPALPFAEIVGAAGAANGVGSGMPNLPDTARP